MGAGRNIVWFAEPECRDVSVAGGKGASLANMAAEGLPVPGGFVIPSHVMESSLDVERLRSLARERDHKGCQLLVQAADGVRDEILAAYRELGGGKVAVRSSACAEDSEAASYAGQQETFLNVSSEDEVCERVVECWMSFFSERALFYRSEKGSLDDLRMAVVVQRMVDAEKAGVVFSVHPVTKRRDRMLIEAVYGLGEQMVSGEVTPDHYVVDRKGVSKKENLVHGGVLTPEELVDLATLADRLEKHFGRPQDIEWAIAAGSVHLLQSRPVTTL